jgi:hypothetical protein
MRCECNEKTTGHALECYFTSLLFGRFHFIFGITITCVLEGIVEGEKNTAHFLYNSATRKTSKILVNGQPLLNYNTTDLLTKLLNILVHSHEK